MEKTKGHITSLMEVPVKEKIMVWLEKISKKLEKFIPPVEPGSPQSEDELDAYLEALKVYRDSLKAYQELNEDFIELNTLLANELPYTDPNVVMFYHRASALREIFSFKLVRAPVAIAIEDMEKQIEQVKAYKKQIEEAKKKQG